MKDGEDSQSRQSDRPDQTQGPKTSRSHSGGVRSIKGMTHSGLLGFQLEEIYLPSLRTLKSII